MANVTSFPDDIFDEIEYYVYRLIDPRNNETFYVGKGQGNRVFDHAKGALKPGDRGDILPPRIDIITDILRSGKSVDYRIHRWAINYKRLLGFEPKVTGGARLARLLSEKIAYEVEAAIIDCYDKLANQISGRHSDRYGTTTVQNLFELLSKEEVAFEAGEPVLLLDISRTFPRKGVPTRDDIYQAVRYAWPINLKKVRNIKYVLAHREGSVKAIYADLEWRDATPDNFPDMPDRMRVAASKWKYPKRGFDGVEISTGSVAARYLGKKIPKKYRGAQNGVRYAP